MGWRPDILPGFEALTLRLDAALPAPGEPDAAPTATLVRRSPARNQRAVLWVHGWNDYFFHRHVADFFAARGVDFYALDLRRSGRSLQPGQLAGYITELEEYFDELDAAYAHVAGEHRSISVMGHSTGGLAAALWADQRPGRIDALILNSPWLDLQGSRLLRAVITPFIDTIGQRAPTAGLPLADEGAVYARSLHTSFGGEWSYDLGWKEPTPVIRVGWIRAVLRGHDQVAAGLDVQAPVLVLTAAASSARWALSEEAGRTDIVLDVKRIRARAVDLGGHVTIVRIPDGVHDLSLSIPPARSRFLAEIGRWLDAYVPDPSQERPGGLDRPLAVPTAEQDGVYQQRVHLVER